VDTWTSRNGACPAGVCNQNRASVVWRTGSAQSEAQRPKSNESERGMERISSGYGLAAVSGGPYVPTAWSTMFISG
jgi:hypothetical protein